MTTRGKYRDYTVRIGADYPKDVFYEYDHPTPLRVHYGVIRVPSKKEFIVRNFHDATARDRAEVERELPEIPYTWAAVERRIPKQRAKSGVWFWAWAFGTPTDDPFVQLELEMMIDLSQGVSL